MKNYLGRALLFLGLTMPVFAAEQDPKLSDNKYQCRNWTLAEISDRKFWDAPERDWNPVSIDIRNGSFVSHGARAHFLQAFDNFWTLHGPFFATKGETLLRLNPWVWDPQHQLCVATAYVGRGKIELTKQYFIDEHTSNPDDRIELTIQRDNVSAVTFSYTVELHLELEQMEEELQFLIYNSLLQVNIGAR